MDVDPAADIREVGILLPQLFDESGGDTNRMLQIHTMIKEDSCVHLHVYSHLK